MCNGINALVPIQDLFDSADLFDRLGAVIVRGFSVAVSVDDFGVVVDDAQQVFRGDGAPDKFLVLFIPDLVGYHPNPLDTQICRQTLDIVIGLHRPAARLDDHDKLIGQGAQDRLPYP